MSEYKPTEYVVDFGDYRSNRFVELSMALIEHNGAKLHERIVRCRDCKYYDGEPDLESMGEKCWRDPDHTGRSTPTVADGYCWRGERREQ